MSRHLRKGRLGLQRRRQNAVDGLVNKSIPMHGKAIAMWNASDDEFKAAHVEHHEDSLARAQRELKILQSRI
jgi:hypothetical protein